jgi:hypothetical protein
MLETKMNRATWRRSFGHPLQMRLGLVVVIAIAVGFGATSSADNAVTGGNSLSLPATQGATELDDASRARIFHEVLSKFAAGEKPDPALLNQFVSLQNAHVQAGPKLGEKVPEFTLPDQDGRKHTLGNLMGAKGLLLVFVRSADW